MIVKKSIFAYCALYMHCRLTGSLFGLRLRPGEETLALSYHRHYSTVVVRSCLKFKNTHSVHVFEIIIRR